nr:zinc finger, CCHC-type [Tanacetum cinerariifolium]
MSGHDHFEAKEINLEVDMIYQGRRQQIHQPFRTIHQHAKQQSTYLFQAIVSAEDVGDFAPVWSENETLETTRKRMKWENDDYICRGQILNGMFDSLFDIYQNAESGKALWESLESKYMVEDASATKMMKLLSGLIRVQQVMFARIFVGFKSVNRLKMDHLGGEYYDPVYFQSNGIIHQTTTPYTPQQNVVAERKNKTLKEMVNSMLSYSGLSKKGIDCIFIGYAEHSKCYRFYVIEPNDYVLVNSIIESRDAIFDEERFTSIPRPRGMIQPSSSKITEDEVEGCKWILKRKMKVDGSIDKYKARLVIQGFRQKNGIDFFDTYAPVARISTIRLLLALAAIHDLVIHQMDVKTAFLNADLDEEIYMKQPEGFVMPGHESKVCKLKKSLYGLKQAPKQWHQKFDDVVLSNGFSLNQADKCMYSKFDASGKGVIICLYVDDMLIFGTDQVQVNKTKEVLSSKFDMKDLGEAEVILGIRIKRENNCIFISQSHYIEKILTKFNFANCSHVYTPVDPTVSTRPDIAFAVGKLSMYTSNPSALHWQALGYSDASWINNMEDHSSTSGWVFL